MTQAAHEDSVAEWDVKSWPKDNASSASSVAEEKLALCAARQLGLVRDYQTAVVHTCVEPAPGLAVSESFICLLSEKHRKTPRHWRHEVASQGWECGPASAAHSNPWAKKTRFQLQTPTYQSSRRHQENPILNSSKVAFCFQEIDSLDSLRKRSEILSKICFSPVFRNVWEYSTQQFLQQSYTALGWQGGGPANIITLTMPTFLDGFNLETAR